MLETELFDLERRLWLEGAEAYQQLMHRQALMLFPPPTGIMDAPKITAGIATAPRWTRVDFSDRQMRQAGYSAVLAYQARAEREGQAWAALCGSAWVREGGRWLILLHQQTPL